MGSMQSISALKATILPRPAFVPDLYLGSMLDIGPAQLVCLSAGDGEVSVMIQAVDGNSKPEVLTPMLIAIADAATKQSGAVASPGRLRLPMLGVEIPVRSGSWGVRTTTDTWGRNDVLGRMAAPGSNELHITPFVFRAPGRCEQLSTASPFGTSSVTYVKGRRLGGDKWHPEAWEQLPPPFKALQAYACRDVGLNSILIARIDYEKPIVTDADRNTIRQILDDVGDAVDDKVGRQTPAPAQGNTFSLQPTVLSDLQGFDIGPYINAVMSRVRTNWFAAMPEAARRGQQGRVVVGFTIARDGTVRDLRVVLAAEDIMLTNGARAAIQLSSPFPAQPAAFKGEQIILNVSFVYNQTSAGAR